MEVNLFIKSFFQEKKCWITLTSHNIKSVKWIPVAVLTHIQDTEYEVGQINDINDKELGGGDESGRLERCRDNKQTIRKVCRCVAVLSHSEKIRSS